MFYGIAILKNDFVRGLIVEICKICVFNDTCRTLSQAFS